MTGLLAPSPRLAATLALTLGLTPFQRARAAGLEPQPPGADSEADPNGSFAEPPPAPEPGPEPRSSEPLRILEPQPEPNSFAEPPTEPPAPVVTTPAPTPLPHPPIADSHRPIHGAGLIAMGTITMLASSAMLITAMAGPGWAEMPRREAAIVGGLSLPVALAGSGMLVAGTKADKKFDKWARRNSVSPPKSGNGMIVAGGVVTVAGVSAIVAGTQRALTDSTPSRGDWVAVGLSGGLTAVGLAVLAGGMLKRSKFAAWEQTGYLRPGTMALERGAGLSLSGRF